MIQTVPGLALLAFIVLLFALVSLPTVGVLPAIVALTLYALLPILRNTYTGIRQVDPTLVEVARGLGMRPRQILFSVEIPLSLPVIMAGIRISTVWTVGIATLCGLIGAGGLGDLIIKGLRSIRMDYLLAGTVPAAALALLFDWGLSGLEKWFTPGGREAQAAGPAKRGVFSPKWKLALSCIAILLLVTAFVTTRPGASSGGFQAAFDAEFLTRPDGYQGLVEHYGLRFPAPPKQMDPGLMYRAVADGAVEVIDGFATDGRIPAYDLQVLEDDKHFFPPYYAAPLIHARALKRYPQLKTILNRLGGSITDADMRTMNYEVDERGRKARDVARNFLVARRLIAASARPGSGEAGQVTIGGKQFTEQEILGELMALMIEHHANLRVVRKLNLGGTMICFNALRAGDLDIYAEYTGTGLVNILKRKAIADPDETLRVVRKEFEKRYGLIWLEPFGFNNTYTLTMRQDRAAELGIATISDLAEYLNGLARESPGE